MAAADLHRAMQTTLASKRLGTPVFVRYLYHDAAKGNAVMQRLARVVAAVRDWLGQPLERIYAVGAANQRHISVTLECRGGATAVVAWIGSAPRGPGLDLTVIGNHGALYHDFGDGNAWAETAWDDKQPVEAPLLAWIERSLRSGQPQAAR
jgi:hypothetical protein